MSSSLSRSLQTLGSHLSFHLSNTEQANAAFQRWCEQRTIEAKRTVDLWSYCFVLRYYLQKFSQSRAHDASDIDLLIDRAYRKIDKYRSTIKNPGQYAGWVSVVCRNTFINYLRTRREYMSIEGDDAPMLVAEMPKVYGNIGLAYQVLLKAIDRLPPFLQEPVSLRFIEDLTYEEISEALGKSPATVRSYVSKAIQRFREDEQLRAFFRHYDGKSPR